MTNNNKQRRGGRFSRLMTNIGAIVIAIITLIFAIINGLVELDDDGIPPTNTPFVFPTSIASVPGNVNALLFDQGIGAEKGFWQVYFTQPTGSRDASSYIGGVDSALVTAINNVQGTLDIAAFEWNNPALTEAVIQAHERGVTVRMVVDDEHTLEDLDSTIEDIIDAGIPVVDDSRSGLMHNKFMIMDRTMVWTGSMNYTMNGTYRNNNNMLVLRSRRAIESYQIEFNEMFIDKDFASSRSQNNGVAYNQDGTAVQIVFSPEDNVEGALQSVLLQANNSIKFMTFSFTLDEIGETLLARAGEGVDIEGIFEVRGSRTEFSELPRLYCAGLDVREDGNPFTFHHKVFIIDENIVATGSFNFSNNAISSNDENMVIIADPDLAAQYLAEFDRVWLQSAVPDRADITCP